MLSTLNTKNKIPFLFCVGGVVLRWACDDTLSLKQLSLADSISVDLQLLLRCRFYCLDVNAAVRMMITFSPS